MQIDVIVPVYAGFEQTRRCLESVLAAPQTTPFELVLVDDCGPDPELRAYLASLHERPGVTLLVNERNLGFVASVNRGMALHPDRDVVLLNSDTEVANDWLDRLRQCAYSQADIGTATPFSNNATICSYPYEGWAGGVPGTLGLAALDGLFATTLAGRFVDLPTGVGFCMYIRRACLEVVGYFDVVRFGRGYGEENDFCRRAAHAGWRNVLAADVFVYHEGGVSFSDERESLQKAAMGALLAAHSDYLDRVHDFIACDPIGPLRQAIDHARSEIGEAEAVQVRAEQAGRPEGRASKAIKRPVQLHIAHSWGGGASRWVTDFVRGDGERRNLILRSRSDRNAAGFRLELVDSDVAGEMPLAAWDLTPPIRATALGHAEYGAILQEIIRAFGVQAVLVSSLIGHSLDALDTGLPTALVLHDLYPFCPALFACFGTSCTTCTPESLRACLRENPYNSFWHNTRAEDWQALRAGYVNRLLNPWVRIVAPTRSVRDRWSDLLPGMADRPWHLIGHGLDPHEFSSAGARQAAPRPTGKLRVVIPGRLAPHKGLHLFRSALPELLGQAEILLLGCGDFGKPFRNVPGIRVVPEYDRSALADEIRRFEPDCALLLSVLPESFSYTLSEMLALEIPVLATRLGAFRERIEHGVNGMLFEPCAESLIACVREVAADRTALDRIAENLSVLPHRSASDMVCDYHALLPIQTDDRGSALLDGLVEAAHARMRLADDNKRLLAEVTMLRARVPELDREVAGLIEAQLSILHSSSWRMTAPLRAVKRLLGRMKAALSGTKHKVSKPQAGIEGDFEGRLDRTLLASQVEVGSAERTRSRDEIRHGFGIPDAARIVFGFGPSGSAIAAARLVRAARLCTDVRNDICFVLCGTDVDDKSWADWSDDVAMMVSTRRLFFSWPELSPERLLQAADGLISTMDGEEVRASSLVALRAGMLLMTNEADYLPPEVRASPQVVMLPGLDGAGCAKALADWLDLPDAEQARIVARNSNWLDRANTSSGPAP